VKRWKLKVVHGKVGGLDGGEQGERGWEGRMERLQLGYLAKLLCTHSFFVIALGNLL
jgi:hypothetical protein